MSVRTVAGRAPVVGELRAAAPLLDRVGAPLTARGPWLTAVLNATAPPGALLRPTRPAAVVVEAGPDRPAALALLSVRRGPRTTVTLLGDGVGPVPGGRPPARLPAADPHAAELLAGGVVDLLDRLRGPWSLRLAGLPLGDPVLRALAARLPTARLATVRSTALVDDLGTAGVTRSGEPAELDRRLPELLAHVPDRRARTFLRACARLHVAAGRLELAVAEDGGGLRAALLTLVDGADRWPWWGTPGRPTRMGTPLVQLTAASEPGRH